MAQNEFVGWEFVDKSGSFRFVNAHRYNSLYFPLTNEAGIFSSITPTLHGDIKADHNSYLTPPVSIESLHDSRSARNFWVQIKGAKPWSATGNSALQMAEHFSDEDEETILESGFLWQRVIRKNERIGMLAEIINFVPASTDRVELMKICLRNLSDAPMELTPTAAIPIYGRSADNLRDHRHVTSLLQRTRCVSNGVLVTPTLSFDERGHQPNLLTYAVLGVEQDGTPPIGFFPVVEDFIGDGGNLDWPQAIIDEFQPVFIADSRVDGIESLGGLRFTTITLSAGESHSYVLLLAIMDGNDMEHLLDHYGSENRFNFWLDKTKAYWKNKVELPRFSTGNARYEGWLQWVTVQPVLRRYFGNSYLPYHDYGRGGRGWRDLWQDILALLIMESGDVSEMLYDNFAGIRMDGSNATIIGSRPGEFKADRNNIPRVWMDHGAWPLLTTSLYIDQTGDLAFLLRSQFYFKDRLASRARQIDTSWSSDNGTKLLTPEGSPVQGTILEHLLVQHLVQFFNVGEHNNIRLEGADWNDAMDMAGHRGESVAFSALYAGNLQRLSEWVLALGKLGLQKVDLAEELFILLDTLGNSIDYSSVRTKQKRLDDYFESCIHTISGRKLSLDLKDLANDLAAKGAWLSDHIRTQEWLTDSEGFSWFNGYYDDNGNRVEGDFPGGVRMTLTGQVFPMMGGVATKEQAVAVVQSVDHYLLDKKVGGYRLNTNFGEGLPNLGRAFGFAFGHKENGAMFSHMAVMYAYALYQHGMVRQGYKVLEGIYQHCQDFSRSRIYPGIPEYINERGRGMYTYLTGSASWYLLTLVNGAFGVRGLLGDLFIEPKLVTEQFDSEGLSRLTTRFAGRLLEIVFINRARADFGEYMIGGARLDGRPIEFGNKSIFVPRDQILSLDNSAAHNLEITLRKSI